MEKKRKRYNDDFRRNAVNLLLSSGKSMTQIADEMGIELYNLARWKKEFLMGKKNQEEKVETPAEKMKRLERENTHMAREIVRIKQENEILKKAMGIVSKQ